MHESVITERLCRAAAGRSHLTRDSTDVCLYLLPRHSPTHTPSRRDASAEASGLSPVLLRISAVRSRMSLRGGETKGGGRFSLGDTLPVHGRSSTTTGTRPPGKGMRKSSWSCIRKSVSLSVQERGRPMDDDDDMGHGEPWRDAMSTRLRPTILRVSFMQLWAATVVI